MESSQHQHSGHMEEMIPLGLYIWLRIRQCGVGRIFGVPGDFNLALLDYIYEVDGLEWVGSTNELNAAYATDGYARGKGGAGCFVTTHGVGEMSAINGVAGSMTEQVKIIHVVGQTSRKMQEDRLMIHHSIGAKPDHQVYARAADGFRCAAATLLSEETAAEDVDRVLRECFVQSKPVYIYVPTDMVTVEVPSSRLNQPLDLKPSADLEMVKAATDAVLEVIYNAKRPGMLVDSLVRQHGAIQDLHDLLEKLHIPLFTSVIGKGIIDEDHPCFLGMYNGTVSSGNVRAAFEACDTIIVVGNLPSDSNTGGYTRKLDERSTIYVNPDNVVVKGESSFVNVPMKTLLKSVASELDSARVLGIDVPVLRPDTTTLEVEAHITQAWIWPRLARFFQPGDVVLGETGTASFGLPLATFPSDVHWITQAYYGSIGFATPAAFGADVALKELASTGQQEHGRTVLITGDGSLQLTVQEIGNMIKHGASPVVFIINNAGYTIERAIHGAHKSYNDIVPFDYSHMLQFFGMPSDQAKTSFHRASTRVELDVVLQKECVTRPTGLQIVEIVMDKMDIPWSLATQLALRGPEIVEQMRESGFTVPDVLSS